MAIGIAMNNYLTITKLVFWKPLHQLPFWPSDGSSPWVILAWAAAALMIPIWLKDRADGEQPSFAGHQGACSASEIEGS